MSFFPQQRYSQNPTALFKIIRHCLLSEMKLVAQVDDLGGTMMMNIVGDPMMVGDAATEIAQQFDSLRRGTQETDEDLRKMAQELEAFALSYHECTKINATLQHLSTQPHSQQNLEYEQRVAKYVSLRPFYFFNFVHFFLHNYF